MQIISLGDSSHEKVKLFSVQAQQTILSLSSTEILYSPSILSIKR